MHGNGTWHVSSKAREFTCSHINCLIWSMQVGWACGLQTPPSIQFLCNLLSGGWGGGGHRTGRQLLQYQMQTVLTKCFKGDIDFFKFTTCCLTLSHQEGATLVEAMKQEHVWGCAITCVHMCKCRCVCLNMHMVEIKFTEQATYAVELIGSTAYPCPYQVIK